jgi:hypothetical protein
MTLSGLFLLTVFYGVGALAGGAKLKGGNAGGKFLMLKFFFRKALPGEYYCGDDRGGD